MPKPNLNLPKILSYVVMIKYSKTTAKLLKKNCYKSTKIRGWNLRLSLGTKNNYFNRF
jgi:hypothetical protein